MRSLALLCLVLTACGPVLLHGDQQSPQAGVSTQDRGGSGASGAGRVGLAGTGALAAGAASQTALPQVVVVVQSTDCGRCFLLQASAAGGAPPYQFEWDDGTRDPQRRVCLDHGPLAVGVVAHDANAAQSAVTITGLESDVDAGCSLPAPAKLCLTNPSFEGAAAINIGLAGTFDGAAWSVCTASGSANTPDIVNDSFAQLVGQAAPKPTEGKTFLALAEGEQVSQTLCDTVQVGAQSGLTLDLTRVNSNAGGATPSAEALTLEIWGGLSADCSQRQLLWKSPPIDVGWKPVCVKLKPLDGMDQITLRATSNMPASNSTYLLVDNLVASTDCP